MTHEQHRPIGVKELAVMTPRRRTDRPGRMRPADPLDPPVTTVEGRALFGVAALEGSSRRQPSSRPGAKGIEQVFEARPTGFERADAINIRIPIEEAEISIMAESA
jgi:hypothetical protein